MRITIINPTSLIFAFGHQWKAHNYFSKYIQTYKPNIYLTDLKKYLVLPAFCQKTDTKFSDFNLVTTIKSIKRNTDVLLYPWGIGDGDIWRLEKIKRIFRGFDGMKVFHVMDPQYMAARCNEMLDACGVDYIMGYARHDRHSSFFRNMHPKYNGRVIGVPFGFNDDWVVRKPFNERQTRCLGTGTVEPFDSDIIISAKEKLQEYLDCFSKDYHCVHELRYLVNRDSWKYRDVIDCKFHDKNIKNQNYVKDVVGLFNDYKMFINDESLMNFPPIRTYEGIAAGCVMVCNENSCYTDYGFQDKINCIMFKKYDLSEMLEKIKYYLFDNPEELERIQKRAVKFVRSRFNHASIADLMHSKLKEAFNGK